MENINLKINSEIDIEGIIKKLIKRIWIIVLAVIISVCVSYAYSAFYITPLYESSTTVYILNSEDETTTKVSYSDVQIAALLTSDFEHLIKSRHVLGKVIDELKLNTTASVLSSYINVSTPSDSRVLEIKVTYPDPEMAQKIADVVREVSSVQIEDIMGVEAVNLIDVANMPTYPVSPNVRRNVILGGLVGFVFSTGFIVVLYLLNDRINSVEDVEKYLKLSVLGSIPTDREKNDSNKSKK